MATKPFNLESLLELDQGRIREAFQRELRHLEADCKDRPALGAVRELTLKLTLSPMIGDDGDLESVNVQAAVSSKVPRRSSKTYNMQSVRGGLIWNELAPDDVRQSTIDEIPQPEEQVG